ncbi:hypothetical protein BJ546DRAFT_1121001 [Cryomyces antarcticus]
MTDINQWRRMIQPARVKTPQESDEHGETASNVPATPRRRSRPKFSMHLSSYRLPTLLTLKPEPFSVDHFPAVDPSTSQGLTHNYNPNPEQMIDSVFSRLLVEPFKPLPVEYNGPLLQIIEVWRHLKDDKTRLTSRLSEEVDARHALMLEAEKAERRWAKEREEYKAEVKRLELLIAKGKRGLVDVMKARQNSVLRRTRKRPETQPDMNTETVYEFLQRTRREEEVMLKSQRVLVHSRPASPSHKMTVLSHKLSTTSFHEDTPFGTPPPDKQQNTLAAASKVQDARAESRSDASADAHSFFTSSGDLLPDEMEGSPNKYKAKDDHDISNIRQLIAVAAHRRGVTVDNLFPKVMEHFGSNGIPEARRTSKAPPVDKGLPPLPPHSSRPESTVEENVWTETAIAMHLKPSRPVLQVDTNPRRHRRPFSFDTGDDTGLLDVYKSWETANVRSEAPPRRSLSFSDMDNSLSQFSLGQLPSSMSPRGPPCSPSLCGARLSKIPSPALERPLARPRREDSSSSFLTALRHFEAGSSSRASIASGSGSRKSIVTAIHGDSNRSSKAISKRDSENSQKHRSGQRLVDDKNSLRNDMVPVAAARATGLVRTSERSLSNVTLNSSHDKRFSTYSGSSNSSKALSFVAASALSSDSQVNYAGTTSGNSDCYDDDGIPKENQIPKLDSRDGTGSKGIGYLSKSERLLRSSTGLTEMVSSHSQNLRRSR